MGMDHGDVDMGPGERRVDWKALAMLERAGYPLGWRRLAIYTRALK